MSRKNLKNYKVNKQSHEINVAERHKKVEFYTFSRQLLLIKAMRYLQKVYTYHRELWQMSRGVYCFK